MSEENVGLARQVLDAVERRDLPRLLELTDPEVEWKSFFAVGPDGAHYKGHDGMRRYVADLEEVWETLRPYPSGLLDVGDLVVGVGRIQYRGKASGVETEEAAGWVFRFRDGRLQRFRAFSDPEHALEAAGLVE
jgi:ketosteroid isomerase-like protein